MNGIVFFDYDGTLADPSEGVSVPTEATVRAISALRRNGYLPVLCTGRSFCYRPQGAEALFDIMITANGAGAWQKQTPLWRQAFSCAELRALADFFSRTGAASFYETDEGGYSADLESPLLRDVMKAMAFSAERFRPLEADGFTRLPICKCVAFFNHGEHFSAFTRALGGRYEIRQGKNGWYADVNQKGMTKGVGAARLARMLGVAPENTYAFGDGENDLELLQTAGTGVAMSRHAKSLEAAAAFITGSVAENGVAQGLIRLGLISG